MYVQSAIFLRNNFQTSLDTLQNIMPPRWDNCAKSVYKRKNHPTSWDLTCIQVRSHLGGTNPLSRKQFVYTEWLLGFCRDLAQMRRLTWVGWFFSYKQLLTWYFNGFSQDWCKQNKLITFVKMHIITVIILYNSNSIALIFISWTFYENKM